MIERMTTRLSFLWTSCFLAAMLFAACTEDLEQTRQSLNGRWELSQAFRNQKQTEMLSGVYFQFEAGQSMRTNFPASGEDAAPFDLLSRDEIVQQFPVQPVHYKIKSLSDTTLVLTTELRGALFELQLVKR